MSSLLLTDTTRHLFLIFGSFLISFLIAIILARPFARLLLKFKLQNQIRENDVTGVQAKIFRSLHLKKKGVPTMGGILIWGTTLLVILISRLLSYLGFFEHSLLNRKETYLPLFALITTACLGAFDDFLNIRGTGKTKGLKVKPKFLWLILFGLAGGLWFYFKLGYDQIHIPGIGDFALNWWYIPLFILVIVATSNAVNLTDGLDGLASGLLIIAFSCFGALSFANGLFILAAFCAVIVGATLAFLWFNIPPALFYLGDTGALSLGATLGVIALLNDQVIVLPLIGFIFVIETLSVIIQIFSKKVFKKKVFKIAPLHHHFEALGWPETKVTMRLWMIGSIFAGMGLIIGLVGQGI